MLGVYSTRVLESLQYQYKLLMYILTFVLLNLENLRANHRLVWELITSQVGEIKWEKQAWHAEKILKLYVDQ